MNAQYPKAHETIAPTIGQKEKWLDYQKLNAKVLDTKNMAAEKVGEKYFCEVCGNEIEVTKAGGGTLVCCGQDMTPKV